MRLYEIEADYIEKSIIPGIECVGEIADASCIPGADRAFLERVCRRAEAYFTAWDSLFELVYLIGFHSNWPTQHVIDDIFAFIDRIKIKPCIGASYGFGDIREACMALDGGKVKEKIVVDVVETL